jgi:polyphosphate kinase
MPRNLERRVEILFPVEAEELKKQLWEILDYNLKDTVKAHILQPDGTYEKPDRRGKLPVGAQMTFCEMAIAAAKEERKKYEEENSSRVFIPIESHE